MYGEDHDGDHGLETSLLEKAEENNNHTISISPAWSVVDTM